MGVAGEATEHPSDLTKVPGRIIERRMVRVFSFRTFLTEECFEMVHYAEPGKKPKWGYFPSEGHPDVVTSFEGTRATPEFLQAIAYEVYVKNVTFGLLHQWLTDMGMTLSLIHILVRYLYEADLKVYYLNKYIGKMRMGGFLPMREKAN